MGALSQSLLPYKLVFPYQRQPPTHPHTTSNRKPQKMATTPLFLPSREGGVCYLPQSCGKHTHTKKSPGPPRSVTTEQGQGHVL